MAVHTCNPNIQRRVGYTAASTDCAFNRTVVAPGLPAQFHRETRQLLSSGVCGPTVRSEQTPGRTVQESGQRPVRRGLSRLHI